jgi:hypothetical protein
MNDSTQHYGSEIAIGIVGFLVIGLFVAMIVLIVAKPVKYADTGYPIESNAMAIENCADYGAITSACVTINQMQR